MLSPVKVWRRQKEIRGLLNRQGVVVSWTKIYTPPIGFKSNAPYYVIVVEFKNKTCAFGQLVDVGQNEVNIGMKVISILRKVREVEEEDVIAYGLKFKPVSS